MASKYASVISKLPKFIDPDAGYQEKVRTVKATITESTPAELSGMYSLLRARKEEIEDELYAINIQIAACSQKLIDVFEEHGLSSVKLTTGEAVRTQSEPYAVVRDKELFRQWCIDQGLERSMHLSWQSANSMVKERLQEGEDTPSGVEAFVSTKVVLTKAKAPSSG